MSTDTPFDRIPPRQKLIRSVFGFALIVPLAAISFWYMGMPVVLNMVVTALCAIVGGVQIASTFREWRAETTSTKSSPPEPQTLHLPTSILVVEGVGLVLLTIGGLAIFERVEVLPAWSQFDGYEIALVIAGSAAVFPALLICIRLAILSARRRAQ